MSSGLRSKRPRYVVNAVMQPTSGIPALAYDDSRPWHVLPNVQVEGAFSGVFGSLQGAFLGTLMGTLTQGPMAEAQAGGPTAQMMQMGGPLTQARNFAVMTGTNAGINAFMRRYRKVEDIQLSLIHI